MPGFEGSPPFENNALLGFESQRPEYPADSLFFSNFIRFLGSDVNLFFIFGRLFEVPDPFSDSLSNLGELSRAKDDQDDDQDND